MSTWILVANASEACLYHGKGLKSKELTRVHSFSHPESREKGIDLTTDGPGSFKTNHSARSSYEKSHPKEVEAELFAKELTDYLDKGRRQNEFDDLLIFAPAHFYGLMHKHLSKHLDYTKHLAKDYTKCTLEELVKHIDAEFI